VLQPSVRGELFAPVEKGLSECFIPALFRDANVLRDHPNLRQILALSVKAGGLGIRNPLDHGEHCYETSIGTTKPLVDVPLLRVPLILNSMLLNFGRTAVLCVANLQSSD
ncbi:MAG: hypothetical protein AAFN81_34690, partial [Bacteroidota bacterium]